MPRPGLRRLRGPGAALALLAALVLPTSECHAFNVVFHSEPAATGAGNAYILEWVDNDEGDDLVAGAWGDTIRNDQGFKCGGAGEYDARLAWPDGASRIVLHKVRMGFTHDGLYRCKIDTIESLPGSLLHPEDTLHVTCAADGACTMRIEQPQG